MRKNSPTCNIALIPARGGSNRVPRKNIREFNGKPLIAWSIAAAQTSGLFERILVSTDDEEIGSISKEYGAEVPFKRPPELSNDFTGTDAVVSHALDWLVEQKCVPDFICCIYPTAPLLTGQTIIEVLNALHESEASSAFVACTFAHPVWRGMSLVEGGYVEYRWPEHQADRSQDLPELIHDAGQCYWVRASDFQKETRLINKKTIPVIVPRWQAQDIDTEEDWQMAERLSSVRI